MRARDYSACPAGWADLGDGANCMAPLGFEGPCDSIVPFGGLAPKEKSALASRCGATFPCTGARPADYSVPCPAKWSLGSDGDCFAPAEYTGPCVTRKRFFLALRSLKNQRGPSNVARGGPSEIRR